MAFSFIRNEYQCTPLERIELSITGAQLELSFEKANYISVTDKTDRERLMLKINSLERTILSLQEEAALRKDRVRQLVKRIGVVRQFGSEDALVVLLRKVNRIDGELGPFRWSSQPFRLH